MKYIKGYDGLRAISILFVLCTHLGSYLLLPSIEYFQVRVFRLISGDTGVNIFFALSGFLITRILIKKKKKEQLNLTNFYIRRFLRLVPPLVVFFSVIAYLMAKDYIKSSVIAFAYSFFYLYNFVPEHFYIRELAHTWSLALEEQFYLTWPLIVLLFNRKWKVVIAYMVIIACVGFVFFYNSSSEGFNAYRWFIPAVGSIMFGCLFSIYLPKINPIIALILYLFPLYCPTSTLKFSFLVQAMAVSIMLVWIYRNQDSVLVRVLSVPLLVYIGKISYGLYVYQGLFLRNAPGGDLWFQSFPVNIVLTFIIAILSYRYLEKPALRLKKYYQ